MGLNPFWNCILIQACLDFLQCMSFKFLIEFLKIELEFYSEEPDMFSCCIGKYYVVKNELEGGTVKQKRSH